MQKYNELTNTFTHECRKILCNPNCLFSSLDCRRISLTGLRSHHRSVSWRRSKLHKITIIALLKKNYIFLWLKYYSLRKCEREKYNRSFRHTVLDWCEETTGKSSRREKRQPRLETAPPFSSSNLYTYLLWRHHENCRKLPNIDLKIHFVWVWVVFSNVLLLFKRFFIEYVWNFLFVASRILKLKENEFNMKAIN